MPTSIAIAIAVETGISLAVATFLVQAAGSFIASQLISAVFSPEQKGADQSFSAQQQQHLITTRQAAAPWRYVYGEEKIGGVITYMEATTVQGAENNNILHMVITLAAHVSQEISDIYFDHEVVPIDDTFGVRGGHAIGKYAGYVQIIKSLGDEAGQPFPELVAMSNGLWTDAHRQTGHTKIYVRLVFGRAMFPTGIPNITVVMKGKKVYDPRPSPAVTAWSRNAALINIDYLCDNKVGPGFTFASDVHLAQLIAAANASDEEVEISGTSNLFTFSAALDIIAGVAPNNLDSFLTGTGIDIVAGSPAYLPGNLSAGRYYLIRVRAGQIGLYDQNSYRLAATYADALAGIYVDITGDPGADPYTFTVASDPRYACDGGIIMEGAPKGILSNLLTSCSGSVVPIGGEWWLFPGVYNTPTDTLTVDDLRGPVHIQPRISKAQLANRVKGIYASPGSFWQPTDYPPVVNATYLAEDQGEENWLDADMPFTKSAAACQRIAKIQLEKIRQQQTLDLKCKLTAWRFQPGDVAMVTLPRYGYAAKPFDVVESTLVLEEQGDGIGLGVDLILRETAAAVYDWNSGEETTVDPAPDTNLPDYFTIMGQVPPTVSGLEIFGQGLDRSFTGRDLRLVWRKNSTTGSYEMGAEPQGGDDGLMDEYFKDYQVVVLNADGATVRRIEHVLDPAYTYTFQHNVDDGLALLARGIGDGLPARALQVRVKIRSQFGKISVRPALLDVNNPAPSISGATLTGIPGGFAFVFQATSDTDYLGAKVYASVDSGFTPGDDNLIYNTGQPAGGTPRSTVAVEHPGATYYVKLRPYDTFGDGADSSELSVATGVTAPAPPIGASGDSGALAFLTSVTLKSLLGCAAAVQEGTVGQPIYCPNSQRLVVAVINPDDSKLYLVMVDRGTLQLVKTKDTGITPATPSLILVYAANTGRIFCRADSAAALLYEFDATTLELLSTTALTGTAKTPKFYNPVNGNILLADASGASSVVLAHFNPSTLSKSAEYTAAVCTAGGAANLRDKINYVPGADAYALTTWKNVGATRSEHSTIRINAALSATTAYAHTGSVDQVYAGCYCPFDDRVWQIVALSGGGGTRLDLIKSDATLDASITPGGTIAPTALANIGWLQQVMGFGVAASSLPGATSYSPHTHTMISGGMGAGVSSTGSNDLTKIPESHLVALIAVLSGIDQSLVLFST